MSRFLFALSALLVVGCQSHETGIATVCSAPVDCKDCMSAPVELRESRLSAHIEQRVRNDRTTALWAELANLPPLDRGARLREEAASQGVSACPMADVLDSNAKSAK